MLIIDMICFCLIHESTTDCSLSLNTTRVRIPAGACENIASDLGLGDGLCRERFRHHLQRASHELA